MPGLQPANHDVDRHRQLLGEFLLPPIGDRVEKDARQGEAEKRPVTITLNSIGARMTPAARKNVAAAIAHMIMKNSTGFTLIAERQISRVKPGMMSPIRLENIPPSTCLRKSSGFSTRSLRAAAIAIRRFAAFSRRSPLRIRRYTPSTARMTATKAIA